VSRLDHLSNTLDGDIWLKNDGLYGTVYGGNKPRKLEFMLADALDKGARTVITTGGLGTNHGLATALYGRQLGLDVVLLLTYEEPGPEIAGRLCELHSAGARLHYTRSLPLTIASLPYFMLRYRSGGRAPYFLGPGASTPLGALGYVSAALELAEQVRAGDLPAPRTIIVPAGTGGTAAGLALGLRLAGLSTQVLAVAVTRAPTAWSVWVVRLANSTGRLLRERGLAAVPRIGGADVSVARAWLGPGFGRASDEGEEARRLALETEGLAVEHTYTAKTLAALIALQRARRLAGPVLYWHTYNTIPRPRLTWTREDADRLPRAFHRFCGGIR